MKLLLDTHMVLWLLLEPEKLSSRVVQALQEPGVKAYVSAVTAWEIAIKQSLGKLDLPGPAEAWLLAAVNASGLRWLDVSPTDAVSVRTLPWHHRDPFDRLLVAQAQRGFVLVTNDAHIPSYGVTTLR